MDYNVRYVIDINGQAASQQLSMIANQVATLVPQMTSSFKELTKAINLFNSSMSKLTKTGTSAKINIDTSKATQKIEKLQAQLNALNATRVNPSVTPNMPPPPPNSRPSNQPRGNRRGSGFGGDSGSFGYYRSRLGTTGLLTSFGVPYAGMIGTVAIGRGLSAIVKEQVQYEHTMDLAHSILKAHAEDYGVFENQFAKMAKNMRQIGVDTQFTATQVADATKYLAMAGLNVTQIDESMKSIANLAIIGDTDLGQMADLTTNIITGYGIDTSKMSGVADILTSISTGANTNVVEMSEAFKFVGAQMSTAGISFNETSAAIGILGNAGLKATLAGTGLRAMMMRLVDPPKKARKVLDELGVSFTKVGVDGKESIKTLVEALTDLKKSGAGQKEVQVIFDKTASKAALALMTNMDDFKKLITESENSFGVAEMIAKKRQNTIKGLWEQITSQFIENGQNVMEEMQPVIYKYMNDLLTYMKSPGATQMIRDTVMVFKQLLDVLMGIGKFITDNWSWLGKLFMFGFITKKVNQFGIGLLDVADNMMVLLSRMGLLRGGMATMYSMLGTGTGASASGGAASLATGGGLVGAFGLWGVAIAAVVGGIITLFSYIDDTHTKADILIDKMRKLHREGVYFQGFAGSPLGTPKDDLVKTKYDDIFHWAWNTDKENNMLESVLEDHPILNGPEYFRKQMSGDNKSAAMVAGYESNLALSSYLTDVRAGILESSSYKESQKIVSRIREFTDQNKSNVKYTLVNRQPSSIGSNTPYEGGEHGGYNLKSIEGDKITLKELQQTIEYQLNLSKQGKIAQEQLELLLPAKHEEHPATKGLKTAKWIKDILGIDVNPASYGMYFNPQEGKFMFSDSKRAGNIQNKIAFNTEMSKVRTSLLDNYDDAFRNEVVSWLNLSSKVFSNSIGTDKEQLDFSGLNGTGNNTNTSGGSGEIKGTSVKHIVVNIENLMKVDSMKLDTDEDFESFKQKLTRALMESVKDFEITY